MEKLQSRGEQSIREEVSKTAIEFQKMKTSVEQNLKDNSKQVTKKLVNQNQKPGGG